MKAHFNGLSPDQDERLAWLAEECAEVIQAITKIQRHGYQSSDPTVEGGPNNREALATEVGHLLAAMRLLWERDVRYYDSDKSAEAKRESVRKWMHHQAEEK